MIRGGRRISVRGGDAVVSLSMVDSVQPTVLIRDTVLADMRAIAEQLRILVLSRYLVRSRPSLNLLTFTHDG